MYAGAMNDLHYTDAESWAGAIESVSVRRTTDEAYPSGWKYSLHLFRTTDGDLLLRYDNAHEVEKGHERHAIDQDAPVTIDFPGMMALYDRFQREIPEYVAADTHGGDPR